MSSLIRTLFRAAYSRDEYLFYEHVGSASRDGGDASVILVESPGAVPNELREALLPGWRGNIMYHRLATGLAKLLYLPDHEGSVAAYGWLQQWQPFRRRFAFLEQGATMLGPFWTAPGQRGRGLYGQLLRHSIELADRDKPIIVFTSPENRASRRGIEKEAFRLLGCWRVTVVLRYFSWAKRLH